MLSLLHSFMAFICCPHFCFVIIFGNFRHVKTEVCPYGIYILSASPHSVCNVPFSSLRYLNYGNAAEPHHTVFGCDDFVVAAFGSSQSHNKSLRDRVKQNPNITKLMGTRTEFAISGIYLYQVIWTLVVVVQGIWKQFITSQILFNVSFLPSQSSPNNNRIKKAKIRNSGITEFAIQQTTLESLVEPP